MIIYYVDDIVKKVYVKDFFPAEMDNKRLLITKSIMDENELNALKIKLIKWICELEDEAVLKKIAEILKSAT